MSQVVINDIHLINIADAIRAKNGTEEKYTIDEMSSAIDSITAGSGGGRQFEITGDCSQKFSKYTNLFPIAGDYINWYCHDISNAKSMFTQVTDMEKVPFELHFKSNQYIDISYMFSGCSELKEAPVFTNSAKVIQMQAMFQGCSKLKEIPETIVRVDYDTSRNMESIFRNCYSLRSFPVIWFIPEDTGNINGYRVYYPSAFYNCMALDEIVNLEFPTPSVSVQNGQTANHFDKMFYHCYRLKRLKFKTSNYRSSMFTGQILDLSSYIGYANTNDYTLFTDDGTGNSGITENERVIDDESYQALKNTKNWFTTNYLYSRYNRDSAVETLNSLPNTSNYVKSYEGGRNTIKFKGAAGQYTDGGAINTMTEEEIAVATAKGWTVTFV